MKKSIPLSIIFFFLLISLSFAGSAPEGYVAKVGQLPITVYELERETSQLMPLSVSFHGNVTEARKDEVRDNALQALILRTLKASYAIDKGLSVPPEKTQAMLQRLRSKFKTDKELKNALGSESVEQLTAAYEKKLLAQLAEDEAVNSKSAVTDKEVRAYFDKNKDHFLHPKQFRASHILVKVDPAATNEVRNELLKKTEELLERAKAGEDFYNLAYHNSDDRTSFVGGDMGIFNQGQAVPPIDKALSTMKVGEISDIVETLVGFHILKLTQVIEPRQMSFEDLEDKIRQTLIKEQRDPLYEAWMNELKATYKVERYDTPKKNADAE